MSSKLSNTVKVPFDQEFCTDSFEIPDCYRNDISGIILTEGFINDRIKCLSREIFNEIGDQNIHMLCILKGSFRFFTALVDHLASIRKSCLNSLKVDFIRVKSYVNCKSSNDIDIIGLCSMDELKDRNILIVEDIVDSGRTLIKLIDTLKSTGARKIWTAILLSKMITRETDVPEDFVAFEIPDKFVVGYGLDYNQNFRDLNHICVLNPEGIEKYMHK